MNLTLANLIPGVVLIALGAPLALASRWASASFIAFPRSRLASWICFGVSAVWFLDNIWHLSSADHGDYHVLLFCAFATVTVLAMRWAPDFLAVRGLCGLVLLGAMPLLMAGYMNYNRPLIYFQKSLVYVCIALAIWLAAQPWRLRDFLAWLFRRTVRSHACGCLLVAYGMLLCGLALSYT
ncbi:MAG TPA: hypothetical protein VK785_04435 [Opitutaceae bacterium]|jgi:hypothetical protein|nr:hypothetical protein [Opitutaceae bacterium]